MDYTFNATDEQIQEIFELLDKHLEIWQDYEMARCRIYEESFEIVRHGAPHLYEELSDYEMEEITYAWLELPYENE